jgi:stringent starvation protein B
LSLQLLPLKQVVNWLLTNQLTEEIVHGSTDNGKNAGTIDEVHKYFHDSSFSFNLADRKISAMRMHEDEALYARFADDILTPPPNL